MAKHRNESKERKKKKSIQTKKQKKPKQKQQPKSKTKKKEKTSVTKMRLSVKREPIYEKFYDLDEIKEYLCCLVGKHPTRINVRCIGESAQGRPILMAHLTDTGGKSNEQKSITMVEAGSNGSDFYSVSSALYLIDFLLKNTSFLAIMDYIIIPCSNPDGYLYCLRGEGNGMVPVDLSHNYPLSHLGWSDVSRIQTDEFLTKIQIWKENYKYNAPEIRALSDVLSTYHIAIKLLISLQERGERIVFPYGCCDTTLNDEYEMLKVAKSGAAGFKKRCVSVGSIYNCFGLTFGSLVDYIRFEQSAIKFMFNINLFDKESHEVCVEKIRDYGDEVAHCIKLMARTVYMLNQRSMPTSKVDPDCI